MRKILIGIIIIALSILLWNIVINEVSAFGINILGYQKIKELNEDIDTSLSEATMLTSRTYAERYKELENAAKSLATIKKEYQEKTANISEIDIRRANQLNKYEVEFLWTKVGKYATDNNVILKLDIVKTSSGISGNKDLLFTLNGAYYGISEFISKLEEDEKLAFKIEDFSLLPGTSSTTSGQTTDDGTSAQDGNLYILQATFKVTDIDINIENITETQSNTNSTENNTETNKDGKTNDASASAGTVEKVE